MQTIREQMWVAVGLVAVGALIGGLVVLMADPACGPDGDSQKACAAELVRDVGGRR